MTYSNYSKHKKANLITKALYSAFSLCLLPVTVNNALASLIIEDRADRDAVTSIVVDRDAITSQQPTVYQNRYGDTEIHIQAPNEQGLSHNKYTQFDVGNRGVILNNGQTDLFTATSGYIHGNPNLADFPANVILNEVNSTRPSQLRGTIEVSGNRADVIIANPAGIDCNGCGVINSGRVTYTTGTPEIENGVIKGYTVDKGEVRVLGKGLKTYQSDYTEIIARAVKINGTIYSEKESEVTIIGGKNKVSKDTNTIEANGTVDPNDTRYAIDVSALGGMYNGKIKLIGTNSGFGVRVVDPSEIRTVEDVYINSKGLITNNGKVISTPEKEDVVIKTPPVTPAPKEKDGPVVFNPVSPKDQKTNPIIKGILDSIPGEFDRGAKAYDLSRFTFQAKSTYPNNPYGSGTYSSYRSDPYGSYNPYGSYGSNSGKPTVPSPAPNESAVFNPNSQGNNSYSSSTYSSNPYGSYNSNSYGSYGSNSGKPTAPNPAPNESAVFNPTPQGKNVNPVIPPLLNSIPTEVDKGEKAYDLSRFLSENKLTSPNGSYNSYSSGYSSGYITSYGSPYSLGYSDYRIPHSDNQL